MIDSWASSTTGFQGVLLGDTERGPHSTTMVRWSERIMAGLLGEYDRARRCTTGGWNLTRLRRWCKGRYERWIAVPLRWSQAQ
jgi:hypothetical protein